MKHIQVFFQKTISDFKEENKKYYVNFSLILCLISLPLNNFINSFFIVLFFLISARNFKSTNRINYPYVLLIILYVLFLASWFWSVDKNSTQIALLKEIPLLLIPFCFLYSEIFRHLKKQLLIKYYSISIFFYTFYFLLKAVLRFFTENNTAVFFGHELVTKELNAIHFSAFVSVALFYFITKENKTKAANFQILFLSLFLLLLNSKIILLGDILLVGIYFFYYSKLANKMRLRNMVFFGILLFSFLFSHNIKEKIEMEFQLNSENNIGHTVIPKEAVGERIISMKEAWRNDKFSQTDFFSGASFRVYQLRVFLEIMNEENLFSQGLGLNASYKKIEEKGIKYNVFRGNNTVEGYQKKNFHNQYIQVFAELGCIGFLLLILILFINVRNALVSKDFLHIAFAFLMISLFLTESFLWRQRGVVFFTLFYCLFNLASFKNNKP
jgi:O-antigen ligase